LGRDRGVHGPMKVIDVVGNKVGQVRILRVVPALLNRVELRRVRRQGLERKPTRAALLEKRRGRLVDVPAIPDEHDVAAKMAVHPDEQPNHVVGVHVLRHHVEEQRQAVSSRGYADEPDP